MPFDSDSNSATADALTLLLHNQQALGAAIEGALNGFSLQSPARLNAVQIGVDIDIQQDRGMASRPASICRHGVFKNQFDQVRFVDKCVDYAQQIDIRDVIVEALW